MGIWLVWLKVVSLSLINLRNKNKSSSHNQNKQGKVQAYPNYDLKVINS